MTKAVRDIWRNRPLLFAYLFIALGLFLGFWALSNESQARADADHRDDIEQCNARANEREVLRKVVREATSAEGVSTFDLTQIEGFSELPPSTAVYITNLSHALNASRDPEQAAEDRQVLLSLIPPIRCDEHGNSFE